MKPAELGNSQIAAIGQVLRGIEHPGQLADMSGYSPDLKLHQHLEVLEERDVVARLEKLIAWMDATLLAFDCTKQRDPGRVTIRRLNKNEYNNTIRDLLGVKFNPADDFPSDDVGYGFDNIGDVLTMSPLLLEKYIAAARAIIEKAVPMAPTAVAEKRLAGRRWLAGCSSFPGHNNRWRCPGCRALHRCLAFVCCAYLRQRLYLDAGRRHAF